VDRGDVVLLNDQRFLVVIVDEEGNAHLEDVMGVVNTILPSTMDELEPWRCHVICNPTREWPFLQVPSKRWGRVQFVARPNPVGDLRNLVPFEDWVVGEPLRGGGALYIRPTLKLRHMDRVVLFFEKGQTSLIVPRHFLPVGVKAAAAKFSRVDTSPKPLTVYDHLVGNGLGDDDEDRNK
jgi:hypothetical protein